MTLVPLLAHCDCCGLPVDAQTGEERRRWRHPRGEARAVAFVRGGAWLAAGVWPDSLVLWDVRPFQNDSPAARGQ